MLCDDDDHIQDIMHMHDDLISVSKKHTKFQDGMLQLVMTEKLHFFGVAFGKT